MYKIQRSVDQTKQSDFKSKNQVDHLKNQLINYIYTSIDISRFKYELLQYENTLNQLIRQRYFVSANFSGSNCLLVFTTIKGKYHSFMVDRKLLSYNLSKIDMSKIYINNINVKLDTSIYSGSIFDGIYIQTKSEKLFLITDIYLFRGQDFSNSKINDKLFIIKKYLDVNYSQSENDNDIILTVNKLFDIHETENLISNVIPQYKDYSVRGICFYPETSGTKLIFMFGNENRDEKQKSQNNNLNTEIKNIPQTINEHKKTEYKKSDNSSEESSIEHHIKLNKEKVSIPVKHYLPKSGVDCKSYTFEMKKTDKPDVYELFVVTLSSDKKKLKRQKVGIALVPSKYRSDWCKKTLDTSEGSVLVNCIYHDDKQKWEPTDISTATKPSFVSQFDVK